MVGLHSLKTQYGLFGNSVMGILKWVKGLLPKVNTLPNSYPVMKNSLKGLGMKYKSIHACVYDCILYRKVKQVFYSEYINNEPWSIVQHAPRRLNSSVDDLAAPTEYQSIFYDNPNLKQFFNL